jgi:LmbE family N-acetylglucosaminyl deacetylase
LSSLFPETLSAKRFRRSTLAMIMSLALAAAVLTWPVTSAKAAGTTTLSFVAHQDDDLLFMNPDIASDIQAGYNVWVVYLTAGEVPERPAMEYANQRIEGERAAYARAAGRANSWTYEPMYFNGHELATNRLNGTNVHLVFTYVHAAAGACDTPDGDPQGDLYRMLHDDSFVASPIDGRAPYTRASFTGMLRSIIGAVGPDYMRSPSSIGHREGDHVDHTSAAVLVADADTTGNGDTWIRRDEYQGYIIESFPENVSGYWLNEKTAIWDQYWPHDPALNDTSHRAKLSRQYRPEGRIFRPGTPWVGPGDFYVPGC